MINKNIENHMVLMDEDDYYDMCYGRLDNLDIEDCYDKNELITLENKDEDK